MTSIAFFVPGVPVPKGRPRAFRMKNGGIGTYTPDKTVAWEETVRYHALNMRPAQLLNDALYVELNFMLPKPMSAKKRKYPTTKPDLDNLEKAVMDALNGLIYTDDSRVCRKIGTKTYTDEVDKIGVAITIETME